jgi:F0F1-type ATP synthase membrane subunit b/b'
MNNTLENNWNIGILTFVILILLFFWIYKFFFIKEINEQIDIYNSSDI